MVKKIVDLSYKSKNEKINLKGEKLSPKLNKQKLKKNKFNIYKHSSPIKEVKDLTSTQENHFFYIKGKKFVPPKFLGNLLMAAFFSFLIIVVFVGVNIYYKGKKIENTISTQAYDGLNYLIDAGKSTTKIQFEQALKSFEKASKNFSDAQSELWFITTDNSQYSQNQDIGKSITNLLESGKYFSKAGTYFLEALEEFNKVPVYFISKNSPNTQKPSITETLNLGLNKTNLAIKEINQASEKINAINENNLPNEIRAKVTFAKNKISEISNTLNEISTHFPAFLKLLGDKFPHRYLILLQNNNEIRPTGGFIGSYVIMDINDGYIERLSTHDVYEIDGSFGEIVEPPEELKSFTTNWRFRDSNYSPDFEVSAKKARWFLEKEGGPTVDTVIAINQGLLRDLLELTGPIQVGQFGKLDAENYNLLLSYIIEGKIWGEQDPKHILKLFIPAFKDEIFKTENVSKVGSKLYRAIEQKHIVFYSSDEEIQSLFESLAVSGKAYIPEGKEDYLSVINTAYGGTKSEQFIEEKINHETFIDKEGQLINTLTISRSHLWTNDVYLKWRGILKKYGFNDMPDQLIDTLGRGKNAVNTRIYVPAGSILLENPPNVLTKYDKDLKKTYFFITQEVEAGETTNTTLKYRLPFNLTFSGPADTYKLVIEKQLGSRGSIFTKTINTYDNIYNLAAYPPETHLDATGGLIYATNLVYDRYFSAIYSK